MADSYRIDDAIKLDVAVIAPLKRIDINQYVNNISGSLNNINDLTEFIKFWQNFLNISLKHGLVLKEHKLIESILSKAFAFLDNKSVASIKVTWDEEILQNIISDINGYTFIRAHEYSKTLWNQIKEKAGLNDNAVKTLFNSLNKEHLNDGFLKINTQDARNTGYTGDIEQFIKNTNFLYFYILYIGAFAELLGYGDVFKQKLGQFLDKHNKALGAQITEKSKEIKSTWESDIYANFSKESAEYDAKYTKCEKLCSELISKKDAVSYLQGIRDEDVKLFKEMLDQIGSWSKVATDSDIQNTELLNLIISNHKDILLQDIAKNLKKKELNYLFEITLAIDKQTIEDAYKKKLKELSKGFVENIKVKRVSIRTIYRQLHEFYNGLQNRDLQINQYLDKEVQNNLITECSYKEEIENILNKYQDLNTDNWKQFTQGLQVLLKVKRFTNYSDKYKTQYNKCYDKLIENVLKYNELTQDKNFKVRDEKSNNKYKIIVNSRDNLIKDGQEKKAYHELWQSLDAKIKSVFNNFKKNLKEIEISKIYSKYESSNTLARSGLLNSIDLKIKDYENVKSKAKGDAIFQDDILNNIVKVSS